MRIPFIVLALLTTACAQQAPRALPVANGPVACTAEGTLNEGLAVRAYPAQCPDDPALIAGYNMGRSITDLEREVYELDLIRKNPQTYQRYVRNYGFGSSGYYTGMWFRKKHQLKALREQAGLTPCVHCSG